MRLLRFRPARLSIGLSLLVLALAGCSSGSSHKAARGTVVRVTERDFRITVSRERIPAGTVRLRIHNQGPDTHELLVARSPSPNLQLRSDALTVNEEALAHVLVGTQEGRGPGTSEELILHLKPGRYELFCNMAGHYLGGMRAALVVT